MFFLKEGTAIYRDRMLLAVVVLKEGLTKEDVKETIEGYNCTQYILKDREYNSQNGSVV